MSLLWGGVCRLIGLWSRSCDEARRTGMLRWGGFFLEGRVRVLGVFAGPGVGRASLLTRGWIWMAQSCMPQLMTVMGQHRCSILKYEQSNCLEIPSEMSFGRSAYCTVRTQLLEGHAPDRILSLAYWIFLSSLKASSTA
jgi:hypothetical protein